MTRELELTAVFEVVENDWVQARVRELPEVITVAPTRHEAEELLRDALLEYVASLSEPLEGEDAASGDLQHLQLTVS
jgi:predicted RNase H-like HicB family nuclease